MANLEIDEANKIDEIHCIDEKLGVEELQKQNKTFVVLWFQGRLTNVEFVVFACVCMPVFETQLKLLSSFDAKTVQCDCICICNRRVMFTSSNTLRLSRVLKIEDSHVNKLTMGFNTKMVLDDSGVPT